MFDKLEPAFDEALFDRHYGETIPIAITGVGCRFVGAADPFSFWRRLCDAEDFTREITTDDLRSAGFDPSLLERTDFVARASVLDEALHFDHEAFGYSRGEAMTIDPQQRLFLSCAAEALEMAGAGVSQAGLRTGVYGSARMSTYTRFRAEDILDVAAPGPFQQLLGADKDYLALRVAYKLGLTGPAMTVQTACSSSLVAVHLACEALRSGECDMALAGGAALSFPMNVGYVHRPGMIFSSDGRCRPFDKDADGTFMGNGVGVVALRPLRTALASGAPILAVIRGSAVNNDGAEKAGFTAPSVSGQRAVIQEAAAIAGVDLASIGLVEAHGTATRLGDPIEVSALRQALVGASDVWLGSLKAAAGHLDTAAGVGALIKAAFAVARGEVPPCASFTSPNPAIDLGDGVFKIPQVLTRWPSAQRLAGVSSFGIGGANAHAILENVPSGLRPAPTDSEQAALALSAPDLSALRDQAARHAAYLLHMPPEEGWTAYCATQARRANDGYRLHVPGGSVDAAIAALRDFAEHGESAVGLTRDHSDGVTTLSIGAASTPCDAPQDFGVDVIAPVHVRMGHALPKPDAEGASPASGRATDEEAWRQLQEQAAQAAIDIAATIDWSGCDAEQTLVKDLHRIYVGDLFRGLGVPPGNASASELDAAMQAHGVNEQHRQLLERMQRDLCAATTAATGADDGHLAGAHAAAPILANARAHGYERLALLIERAGPRLFDMLTGAIDPTHVIFPRGDSTDVEAMYSAQRDSRFLNALAAKTVAAYAKTCAPDRRIRVLEVGAGTGSMTRAVLPVLSDQLSEYWFTDVGPLFLRRAEEDFAGQNTMRFARFDINQSAGEQGFELGAFDLIIGANVVHNAADLTVALGELRGLLRPGGVILMREIAEHKPLFDMIFGPIAPSTTDNAWRDGNLFPSIARWAEASRMAGFKGFSASPTPGSTEDRAGEFIMLARNPREASEDGSLAKRLAAPQSANNAVVAGPVDGLLALIDQMGAGRWTLSSIRCEAFAPGVGVWRREGALIFLQIMGRDVLQARLENDIEPPIKSTDWAEVSAPCTPSAERTIVSAITAILENLTDSGFCIERLTRHADDHGPLSLRREPGGWFEISDQTGWPVFTCAPATAAHTLTPALYRRDWFEISAPADVKTTSLRHADIGSAFGPSDIWLVDAPAVSRDALYPSLIHMLRRAGAADARVVIRTRGSVDAAPWPDMTHPDASAVASLIAVARREWPSARFAVLDASETDAPSALLAEMAAEALAYGHLVVRRGRRLVPKLTTALSLPDCRAPLSGDAFVITGGLSPLALSTAAWLVNQGVKTIFLVARRRPTQAERDKITALRQTAVLVELIDDLDLNSEHWSKRLEVMLPTGCNVTVLHMAGVLHDGLIRDVTAAQLAEACQAKVRAAEELIELAGRRDDMRVVLYSSAATIFGPAGQAPHAIANALLEGLATAARDRGLDVRAIAWGFWDEGRPERAALKETFAKNGMGGLRLEQGFALLAAALQRPEPVLLAAAIDPALVQQYGRPSAALGATVPDRSLPADPAPPAEHATDHPPYESTSELVEKPCSQPHDAPSDTEAPATTIHRCRVAIRQHIADLLRTDEVEIDLDQNLIRLGLDSLLLLELQQRLNAAFRIALPADATLNNDTIAKLAGYCAEAIDGQSAATEGSDRTASEAAARGHFPVQDAIAAEVADLLKLAPDKLEHDQNLVRLGLDSLLMLELVERLNKRLGVRISAEACFEFDTIAALARHIESERGEAAVAPTLTSATTPLHRALAQCFGHQPNRLSSAGDLRPHHGMAHHPLSALQHRWVSEREREDWPGSAARHTYVEYNLTTADFDIDRFEKAWNAAIQRHAMLRSTISGGMVRPVETAPYYQIIRDDLTALDADARQDWLQATRQRMSDQAFDLTTWPLFEVRASMTGLGRLRLHLDIDTTLIDVESFQILFRDIRTAMTHSDAPPPVAFTMADYRFAIDALAETAPARAALPIPGPPDLPIEDTVAGQLRYSTLREVLPRSQWDDLRAFGAEAGLEATEVLLAIYGAALRPWAGGSDFSIGLGYFDRQPLNLEMMSVVGDASASMLVPSKINAKDSLIDLARSMRGAIKDNLASDPYGVGAATAPVGFTSLLGVRRAYAVPETPDEMLGLPDYEYISGTGHVLHFQALEEHDGLRYHLDYADGVIPSLLAEALILGLDQALRAFAQSRAAWRTPLVGLLPDDPEIDGFRADMPSSLRKKAAGHA